ncbi:MAG: hypothetical protein GWN01_06395 [Nitrosopumilaceae archaeon]|nr:hypothetical protein [Nitrosopumilaceae archaeon]NIU00568.1 hypothetical protein [Nitrosopumilaceae archaeon]NIU86954.1 hypothetical protein [Nitrosopumilaceae archaeon]NIV66418.1 hypothetical protein [Nitrosopumilaceae archaeon]NIX61170.1 hypothetical protein [Nitrosopumilaceae archaeon]
MMESIETISAGTCGLSSIAITPRLRYSLSIIDEVVETVESELQEIHSTNENFEVYSEETILQSLEIQKSLFLVCLSLLELKKRVQTIQGVRAVPITLLFSVPMTRYLSSAIFDINPSCSQKLSELSISLGSLIMDSAIIVGASFDLKAATKQSSEFIDEVKLMVNSKINKLYPNLEIKKPDHA